MVVARAAAAAQPPVDAPPALRRYLRFQKLPPAALEAARRVLDEDDDFRRRVRDVVATAAEAEGGTDALVGEAGWLLLDRPEGWQARLDELVAEVEREAATAAEARDERRAARQLARTRLELDRAQAAEASARADAEQARTALDVERARGDDAERRAGELAERLAAAEAARAEAVRQLKVEERRVADRAAEVRALRVELEAVAAELEQARHRSAIDGADDRGPKARSAATGGGDGRRDPAGPSPLAPTEPPVDRVGLVAAVEAAARAAADLSSALVAATTALGVEPSGAASIELPPPSTVAPGSAAPGRRAAPLPKGMLDDGPSAALFLLRLPAAVVVVDGYNVSMTGWPDLPLATQRRRLVDALRNLQARTGAEPIVVFDGAELASGPSASLPRSVQVRFSPPGVTADDVVVAMVDQLPEDRPVVVASSDRAVRDGARARGANTIAADQLVALLREP